MECSTDGMQKRNAHLVLDRVSVLNAMTKLQRYSYRYCLNCITSSWTFVPGS